MRILSTTHQQLNIVTLYSRYIKKGKMMHNKAKSNSCQNDLTHHHIRKVQLEQTMFSSGYQKKVSQSTNRLHITVLLLAIRR